MTATDGSPHVLYRFYSATGQLLYVGITVNPAARFKNHQGTKNWWIDVAGISIENYGNREDLAAAERRAIHIERPLHNVIHNGPRKTSPATAPVVAINRIPHICNACGLPVVGNSGYIHVSTAALQAFRIAEDEWEKRHAADGVVFINGGDLFDLPNPVRWLTHHRACDPEPDTDDYWLDVNRVDTHEKLLGTTAHLLSKDWLTDTNWAEFIYSRISHAAAVA